MIELSYIAADITRAGAGTALVEYVIRQMPIVGANRIVTYASEGALPFFEKKGFEKYRSNESTYHQDLKIVHPCKSAQFRIWRLP